MSKGEAQKDVHKTLPTVLNCFSIYTWPRRTLSHIQVFFWNKRKIFQYHSGTRTYIWDDDEDEIMWSTAISYSEREKKAIEQLSIECKTQWKAFLSSGKLRWVRWREDNLIGIFIWNDTVWLVNYIDWHLFCFDSFTEMKSFDCKSWS